MTNHLESINLTYKEHFIRSAELSGLLFIASLQAFVHAFIPQVFQTSTTDALIHITAKLHNKDTKCTQTDQTKSRSRTLSIW